MLHCQTALIELAPSTSGVDVRGKFECYQPVGSFKIRGIGVLIEGLVESGIKHIYSSSGGNAGYAAAYASRKVGLPATVIVPQTTKERAKELIAAQGASVITHGANWSEAHKLALEKSSDDQSFLVHPFDHEELWSGHATLIDEVIEQGFEPDGVVVSVGGGGLLCGVMQGLIRNGLQNVPVIAVETEGTASFAAALSAGKPVALERVSGVATSLGATQVCDQLFRYSQQYDIRSQLVSDEQAIRAAETFEDNWRVKVEPACGAALSVFYEKLGDFGGFQRPLVVVCGGISVF